MSRSPSADPCRSPLGSSVARLAARAEAVQDRWRQGEEPDAEAALAVDPELAAARPLALELAYEEFCLREEAGRRPDPHEFAARFPFRTSLLRLIDLHGLFDRHSILATAHRPVVRYLPGDQVGDFLVVRPLGSGGFADVYLARDLSAGRRGVVLKVSAGNDTEANTLGPLAHPHLMPVLSAPRVGHDRVVVMPFYGVRTLESLIAAAAERRPRTAGDVGHFLAAGSSPDDPTALPSPALAVRPSDRYPAVLAGIAGGVAKVLAYLHSRGVAHRDVKPANVLLGDTGHPYLLDFNLSAGHGGDGRVGGTLPYLAPELLGGLICDEAADPREFPAADVYSFGVTMWQALTGEHPFWADAPPSGVERMVIAERMHDRQQAFRPTDHPRPGGVTKPVWGLVVRCLAPDPASRPTAAECAGVLAPARRRSWARWAAVGAVAVALGAGGWAAAHVLASPAEVVPTDPYEKGVYFHDRGEYGFAAMEFAESARRRRSGHHYACAAYCCARANQADPALLYATEAIALGHDHPVVRQLFAHCQRQANRPKEAKANLALAVAGMPDHPCVLHLRAVMALDDARAGRPLSRQLVDEVRFALEGQPDAPAEVWLTLATLYVGLDDHRTAIEMVRRGVQNGLSRERVERTDSVHSVLVKYAQYGSALSADVVRDRSPCHPNLICPIPPRN